MSGLYVTTVTASLIVRRPNMALKTYYVVCDHCKTWEKQVDDTVSMKSYDRLLEIGALISIRCYHGHMCGMVEEQEWLEELNSDPRKKEYTEWDDAVRAAYETPPRALETGEIFCMKCRTIHTVGHISWEAIKVKKANGKAMSLTCQNCGTKHHL